MIPAEGANGAAIMNYGSFEKPSNVYYRHSYPAIDIDENLPSCLAKLSLYGKLERK